MLQNISFPFGFHPNTNSNALTNQIFIFGSQISAQFLKFIYKIMFLKVLMKVFLKFSDLLYQILMAKIPQKVGIKSQSI